MKKVVVIGGGTGTFTVLTGLKKYPLDLSAIVTVADSGGSTGRLRDEFGYLPVGDFRMVLSALAEANNEHENLLRELFLYRFNKGEKGLKGHNFGNLFLVAMTEILGSEEDAFEFASSVLRVKGKVLPITNKDVHLVAKYEDGKVIEGETNIDTPSKKHDGRQKILNIKVKPKARISIKAKKEIKDADLIVLGPGDLYTSLLANIVVGGVPEAIKNSKAKFIYIVNLMTRYGQTHSFTAVDHIREIKKYVGRYPDFVFINSSPLPKSILKKYGRENDFPVKDDLTGNHDFKIVKGDFLAKNEIKKPTGDTLKRSFIRHDSEKLAKKIFEIVKV